MNECETNREREKVRETEKKRDRERMRETDHTVKDREKFKVSIL